VPKKIEDKVVDDQVKQLTLRIPAELHLNLKLKCVKEGRSMGEVLTDLIKRYVEGK
jgi:hypothetical protein